MGDNDMKPQTCVMLDTLDRLALALAGENHVWTEDERRAYERAVSVLRPSRRAIDSKAREKALSRMLCSEPHFQSAQA